MSNLPETKQSPSLPSRAPRRGGRRTLICAVILAAGVAAPAWVRADNRADPAPTSRPAGPTATAYLEVRPPESPRGQCACGGNQNFERYRATFIVLAKRRRILVKAAMTKEIKQTTWYQKNPRDILARLGAAIEVAPVPGTNLIVLRMSGAAPRELPEIVNAVAKILVDSTRAMARQDVFEQLNEGKIQARQIQNELHVIRRAMKALRRADAPNLRQTLDMLGEQLATLTTQREQFALAHLRARQALEAFVKQEKEGLLNTRLEVLRALHEDTTLWAQVQRQEEFRAERDAAAKKLSPSHESVKALDIKLTAVKNLIAKRRAAGKSLTLRSLKNTLERRVTEIPVQMAAVKKRFAETKERSRELQENMASLEGKSARRRFLEESLNTVERRRLELTFRRRLVGPIRIVQPAVVPE